MLGVNQATSSVTVVSDTRRQTGGTDLMTDTDKTGLRTDTDKTGIGVEMAGKGREMTGIGVEMAGKGREMNHIVGIGWRGKWTGIEEIEVKGTDLGETEKEGKLIKRSGVVRKAEGIGVGLQVIAHQMMVQGRWAEIGTEEERRSGKDIETGVRRNW